MYAAPAGRVPELLRNVILNILAWAREQAGEREGAERLARQAADAGDAGALQELAQLREEAGDRQGAERLRRLGVNAAGEAEDSWS